MKKQLFFVLTIVNILTSHDIQITSIYDLLPSHPEIEYIKCHNAQSFCYKPFPISKFPQLQPHEGFFAETFIVKIPNGQVFSYDGLIKIDDSIMEESMYPNSKTSKISAIQKISFTNVKKITGSVAVITTTSDYCYFHWIANVLARLALLELNNVTYDWLYVAQDKPFMKETLILWGIDPAKIIQPGGDTKYIQADTLIVPSPYIGMRLPSDHQYPLSWIPLAIYCNIWHLDPNIIRTMNNDFNPLFDTPLPETISEQDYFHQRTPLCSTYVPSWAINHIRNKLLPCMAQTTSSLPKKIFISRSDASSRKMDNEDEIFALFEQHGFTRYLLSKLSIPEQIALFHNADIIVAAHGAALVDLMFCKPETTVVEIFQARSDSCFYYLSQLLNISYHCIQTMDFENIDEHHRSTTVSLNIIQNFIDTMIEQI